MTNERPIMGPTKGDCECGSESCDLYGTLRKPDRNGKRHVRGCPCRPCLGRRNRAKGDSKARRARIILGIPGANSRHEEVWGGDVRVEVKAGAQVRPAINAFEKMRSQSEASRPIGDSRPFVGIAMPDGTQDGVVMFRLSDLHNVLQALIDQTTPG